MNRGYNRAPHGALDAIRYIVDNGAKWQALPAGFPPWETVYAVFRRWHRAGVVAWIRDQLRRRIRTGKGRCPYPVTLIVDSQAVKGASTVAAASRGYDAGKKINGRKRHIAVDTLGLPVMITVTPDDPPADPQGLPDELVEEALIAPVPGCQRRNTRTAAQPAGVLQRCPAPYASEGPR
ncbi:transposase [Streptomyces hoynatensis]|uniref:transposase n=1 Tax=Streptomyces hoynatensis TaxID=1141874 RepID=UPI003BAB0591